MFVDASALLAMLTHEPDAAALANLLDGARSPITSPIAVFEAVSGLCRKRRSGVAEAKIVVEEFLDQAGIQVVPITDRDAKTALEAFARYGRGRRHGSANTWSREASQQ